MSPVSNAFIFFQDPIICGNGAARVRHQGDLHWTQTALFPWCVCPFKPKQKEKLISTICKSWSTRYYVKNLKVPCKMRKVRVHRGSDDFTANLPEVVSSVAEGDDLSGTHKGEVQRIEEKNDILSCRNSQAGKIKYKVLALLRCLNYCLQDRQRLLPL